MNALVSGYDSDSGSEDERPAPPPPTTTTTTKPSGLSAALPAPFKGSGLASALPAPSASSSKLSAALPPPSSETSSQSGGLGSFLPPPKASASASSSSTSAPGPKKRQIKIDSLSSLGTSDKDAEPESKKVKLAPAATGKLSLFSMLPAPSAPAKKEPTAGEKEEKGGRGSVAVFASQSKPLGAEQEDEEEREEKPKPKPGGTKGNNDFRAMLGLKPAATSNGSGNAKPKQKAIIPVVESAKSGQRPAGGAATGGGVAASAVGRETKGREDDGPQVVDFFSLAPSTSRPATSTFGNASTSMAISSAPQIDDAAEPSSSRNAGDEEEDDDAYKGWQQDPDGSWVPITPEAHAAYAAWAQAEMARRTAEREEEAERGGGGFDPSELKGKRVEDLEAYDAAGMAGEGQLSAQARASGDSKYAKAAAELGSTAPVDGPEKKKDKMTGFKARQKGQLTSLLAMADEKREMLEEKWAKGKGKANEARTRYGF